MRNLIPKTERCISLLLLGVLALTAAGIVLVQFDYDPAAWRAVPFVGQGESADSGVGRENSSGSDTVPQGLISLSLPQSYNAETLSDKINGKAELYLKAGFRQLETQRFGLVDRQDTWMERYIFNMGDYANAFAVFSAQRRPEGRALSFAGDAYLSENGLFLVNGPFYLEVIATDASEATQAGMERLARSFLDAHPVSPTHASPLRFLPENGRVAHTGARVAQNAFGLEGFNDIYTAVYRWDEIEAIGFITRKPSAQEAVQAAEAFVAYFLEYGGRRVSDSRKPAGMHIIEILDSIEVIQTQGTYLYGVHEAGDLQRALTLVEEIAQSIQRTQTKDGSVN